MKKVCRCCGRNRKIGKFGKYSRSSDGKNYYCRNCMMDMRNGYACTPKGRKKQKEAEKKYSNNNKDKISKRKKLYYQKNKERILFRLLSKRKTECILITENNINNKSRDICINPMRK